MSDTSRPLPTGWRWARLGDVCEIIAGQSPPGETYRNAPEGLPFFQGKADFSARHPIARFWCVAPTKIALPGDILISVRAPVGPTNVADVKCCIGRGLAAIRPHSNADRDFVLAALKFFENQLEELGRGSTFGAIKRDDLESLSTPFPPLHEQERIAKILNEQMAAVERARAAAEARLEAAKALPGAYLRTVFEGPEAHWWPRKTLASFAETCSGSTPNRGRSDYFEGSIPWVRTGELKDGIIRDTDEHVTETALRDCSLPILPQGTLLIAMYGQGQTRGRTGILALRATTNQACFAVLPNDSVFDSPYLQYWFRNSYSRLRQETEARGGNQPNLNGIFLKKQLVPLPPLAEQRQMAKTLTEQMVTAERTRKAIEEELDTINKLPAALLRRAFRGEL